MNKASYYNERLTDSFYQDNQDFSKKKEYWNKFFSNSTITLEETLIYIDNDSSRNIINSSIDKAPQIINTFKFRGEEVLEEYYKNSFNYTLYVYKNTDAHYDALLCRFSKIAFDIIGNKITDPIYINAGVNYLKNILYRISYQTLTLEINVCREEKKLEGETPKERYFHFNNKLLADYAFLQDLFLEYPVLLRILCEETSKFIHNFLDFCNRLSNDMNLIASKFNTSGNVHAISIGLGDLHNDSKFNCKIHFTDNVKIMYKPRSHEIDLKFNAFVKWLNLGLSHKLKTFELISCKEYGWSEFIEHHTCNNDKQLNNYYTRIGHTLAILYVLDAVDFHSENLIAYGEYPVLIDLESLFHPKNVNKQYKDNNTSAFQKAAEIIERSVQSTGILPFDLYYGVENEKAVNLSGLREENVDVELKMAELVNKFRDDTMVKNNHVKITSDQNAPTKNVQLIRYLDTIIAGFKESYIYILSNRAECINKVYEFSNVETRRILRSTNSYATILRRSYHPDFLRDGVDRQFIISRLILENHQKLKHSVISSETKQLLESNIPYFTSTPVSDVLMSYKGHTSNFFKVTPMKLVIEKVLTLSPEDLNQQSNLIKMALLANHNANHHIENKMKEFEETRSTQDIILNQKLKYSFEVGNILLKKKIVGDSTPADISWISTLISGKNHISWSVSPISYDLYNGTSGVGLLTTYLKEYTKDKDKHNQLSFITKACEQNISILVDNLEKRKHNNINLGAFTGISSYIYFLQHVLHVNKEPTTLLLIERLHKILRDYITKTKSVDILEGHAGIIMVMVSLFEQLGDERFLDTAAISIDYLLSTKNTNGNKTSWTDLITNSAYSGFAHGTSGIIASLSKYHKYRNRLDIESTIFECLNFEDSLFNKQVNNWYSSQEKNENISMAWCHGAPGILLSRNILSNNGFDNSFIQNDINLALDTILSFGFGRNRSLCHGDMGNLSIIQDFNNLPKVKNTIKQAEHFLHNYFFEHDLEAGISRGVESIGLMLGLSGIGYGFLKLFDNSIPNILALESPTNKF